MLFSEVEALLDEYHWAMWSPSRSNVHFGCNCGCGGDRYTRELWEAEEANAQNCIDKIKEWCQTMGINYDGVD